MSIVSVSNYLKTKVQGITGVRPGQVHDYEDSSWDGYPAISITLKEWEQDFRTTSQNEVRYIFTIRIYQEIAANNIGAETAEGNLRTLADAIIESFKSDIRLNNTAVYTRPIAGRSGYVSDQPIRTYEIDVEVHDLI